MKTIGTSLLLLVAAVACNAEQPAAANRNEQPSVQQGSGGLLAEGAPAPNIESVTHSGQKVRLSELVGRPVVVYFYPKDDTPGCTVQAEGLRDDWPALEKAKAVVLGVSTDDNESHRAFADKYDLPFLLLPDPDQRIARAFGVPLKNGKAARVTFVIDKHGKIAKVFPKVDPATHSDDVQRVLAMLG